LLIVSVRETTKPFPPRIIGRRIILTLDLTDSALADKLLSKYSDIPLFKSIENPDDARDLLMSSLYGVAPEGEMSELSEAPAGMESFLGDYLATIKLEELLIPAIMLEGTLHFSFPSGMSAPITAQTDGPILSYLAPFARDAQTVNPRMAVTPLSKGIVFHPQKFKEVTYANPKMFDAILDDREKILSMLLRYLPINSHAPIGYRLARFLLAQIPENCTGKESVVMTQDEIARRLNCSRATLAKGVSLLYSKGIIQTGHGKISVNSSKLKTYIQKNQTY